MATLGEDNPAGSQGLNRATFGVMVTDDDLMKLMLRFDPLTARIPPGVRAIANAIEAAERERWRDVVAHAASELAELDDETAQVQASALRELCAPERWI